MIDHLKLFHTGDESGPESSLIAQQLHPEIRREAQLPRVYKILAWDYYKEFKLETSIVVGGGL